MSVELAKEQSLDKQPLGTCLVAVTAILRAIPMTEYLNPVRAMGLYAGGRLPFWSALVFTLLLMALADLLRATISTVSGDSFTPFSPITVVDYCSFVVNLVVGHFLLTKTVRPIIVIGSALISSVQYYILHTLGMWVIVPHYSDSLSGLQQCFADHTGDMPPIFVSDMAYTIVLFAVHHYCSLKYFPEERIDLLLLREAIVDTMDGQYKEQLLQNQRAREGATASGLIRDVGARPNQAPPVRKDIEDGLVTPELEPHTAQTFLEMQQKRVDRTPKTARYDARNNHIVVEMSPIRHQMQPPKLVPLVSLDESTTLEECDITENTDPVTVGPTHTSDTTTTTGAPTTNTDILETDGSRPAATTNDNVTSVDAPTTDTAASEAPVEANTDATVTAALAPESEATQPLVQTRENQC